MRMRPVSASTDAPLGWLQLKGDLASFEAGQQLLQEEQRRGLCGVAILVRRSSSVRQSAGLAAPAATATSRCCLSAQRRRRHRRPPPPPLVEDPAAGRLPLARGTCEGFVPVSAGSRMAKDGSDSHSSHALEYKRLVVSGMPDFEPRKKIEK